MDQEFTKVQQDIQQRFAELPEEIVDIILDGTLDVITFDIQQTHKLTNDQIRLLENEIILVLSFFAPREDFADNVAESLGIEHSLVEVIGAEVQTEIFELVEDIFEAVETEKVHREATEATLATPELDPKKAELKKLADMFGKTPQTSTSQVVQTPLVAPVITDDVIPLHTMEGDIQKIHGYGAYVEQKEAGELPK